jgi:hypothetical protein
MDAELAALIAEDDAAIDAAEACANFVDTPERLRARRRLWAAMRSTNPHAAKLAPEATGAEGAK